MDKVSVASSDAPSRKKVSPKAILLFCFRWGIFLTVLVFLYLAVAKSVAEFESKRIDWRQFGWGWLVLSGSLYLLGSMMSWVYWHRVLWAIGERPTFRETLAAFFIGHLGKYVPGKAMVVVLRTNFVRSERTSILAAATAVFIETLTFMAVGGVLAAIMLGFQSWRQPWLLGLAIALGAAAGIPTIPPLFRIVVRKIAAKKFPDDIDRLLRGITWRLLGEGWILNLIGWALLGFSLWVLLYAIPNCRPVWSDYPDILACVALALVAGFVSLIPGGLGVREMVVLALLGKFGQVEAIAAAVLLRLTWLVSEVAFATILYLMHKLAGKSATPSIRTEP